MGLKGGKPQNLRLISYTDKLDSGENSKNKIRFIVIHSKYNYLALQIFKCYSKGCLSWIYYSKGYIS